MEGNYGGKGPLKTEPLSSTDRCEIESTGSFLMLSLISYSQEKGAGRRDSILLEDPLHQLHSTGWGGHSPGLSLPRQPCDAHGFTFISQMRKL